MYALHVEAREGGCQVSWLIIFYFIFSKQGPLLDPELTILARLASQQGPTVLNLAAPVSIIGVEVLHLALLTLFTLVPGIHTQVLCLHKSFLPTQPSLPLLFYSLTFVLSVICHMRSGRVFSTWSTVSMSKGVQLLSILASGYLDCGCPPCVNKCSFYILVSVALCYSEWINGYIKEAFLLQPSSLIPCVIIWVGRVSFVSVGCMYIFMWACECVWLFQGHACRYMWNLEIDTGCLPVLFSSLLIWTRYIFDPGMNT